MAYTNIQLLAVLKQWTIFSYVNINISCHFMTPNYYIQYHNADNIGSYPTADTDFKSNVDLLSLDNSVRFDSWIYTRKKLVEKAVGQFCFLVVGKTEKIKKYYLWAFFRIEKCEINNDRFYNVYGTGYDFKKPILLNELENFNDFKKFCGNFGIGFQNIDNHIFCKTLISYSSELNSPNTVDKNIEDDLVLALEKLNEEMRYVEPEKRIAEIELILRKDRKIVELLKKSANYKCQFPNCISQILTKTGMNYVEVAHIKAVHKGGQSIIGNLIVLCPNHHKEFDYGNLNIEEQSADILKGSLNGKIFSISLTKNGS